ncbi:MAG: methylated-DNA--[protein]-cysteine S-methyltransferase [Ruminococcaceae bacterium]|nr:methylated-DNA--[protein]-cysteine S-methyltransferase [Oscillospiraceae bacterium]
MVTLSYESPLGTLLLGENGGKLCFLRFPGWTDTPVPGESAVLRSAKNWLDIYFSGSDPGALPAWEVEGTAFQRRVWEALSRIPYGETRTYGQLAAELQTAARPVGGALNKNPLPVFLPCHRIVGVDGSLTGFAGGLEIKEKLLKLERIR